MLRRVGAWLASACVSCTAVAETWSGDTRIEHLGQVLSEPVPTYEDGRMPLVDLVHRYQPLLDAGWRLELIADSRPGGVDRPLPIFALHTELEGPGAWILAGIHGEEPAGPNALAQSVDLLLELGERMPVVVVPLANPWGYVRNWRYLNLPTWSEAQDAQSVGDASHWLADPERPGSARAATASSPEAEKLTAWVLMRAGTHPPRWSIDLHEDNLIDRGYVYSQGVEGVDDPLAMTAVSILQAHDIPLQMDGLTRFGETIEAGIIGPVADSSIDELISTASVVGPGGPAPGPAAHTVLVFETPAAVLTLEARVSAHRALLGAVTHRLNLTTP